ANIGRDLDQIVEHERLAKIEMDLYSREPNVETVKDLRVAKPDLAKQFGFGYLEEPQKLSVINDPRSIDVRPANVFFDCESFGHQHRSIVVRFNTDCFVERTRLGFRGRPPGNLDDS